MKRLMASMALLMALACVARAQIADSALLRVPAERPVFRAAELITPGALMAAGAGVHFVAHDALDVGFNSWTSSWRGDNQKLEYDDFLRFGPDAMHLALGLCGVGSDHVFIDRGIEIGWSYASIAAICYTLKAIVNSPRPDGEGTDSFPSGHACVAFSGAELVRLEYGNAWGAGAYAIAGGVSALRLYNNEHWLSDLLFGAGVGILSARLGEYLTDLKLLAPIQKSNK